MASIPHQPWLHRFAVLTALATLGLIGIGGLVTSHQAGMAVPDWPTSYGYNMFALPFHLWTGGVFYEHTHRLWASTVGVLVVALTRWLGGRPSRKPLAIIGVAEMLAGIAVFVIWPDLKGAGHFLTGIGGVVLLGALVWARNAPAEKPLPLLGWLVFVLVQFQGLLGGLRVVLFKDELGIFHAALAQVFFVLLCAIALFTGRWWRSVQSEASPTLPQFARSLVLATTLLIFVQLMLGAMMRHEHAGLAIPDFPLAYGKVWPDMNPEAVARYNQLRMEVTAANPITAFQIGLQMVHRIVAVIILVAVVLFAWRIRRWSSDTRACGKPAVGAFKRVTGFAWLWLGLILVQVALGAATILTNKAADIATLHVVVGALSLVTGVVLCVALLRNQKRAADAVASQPISIVPDDCRQQPSPAQ